NLASRGEVRKFFPENPDSPPSRHNLFVGGGLVLRFKTKLKPPSTAKICPVMNLGQVAKNKTAAATSAAVPFRCMGVFFAKCTASCVSSLEGKTIIPGATQFTLISGANALAIACVSMCSAAFEAQ